MSKAIRLTSPEQTLQASKRTLLTDTLEIGRNEQCQSTLHGTYDFKPCQNVKASGVAALLIDKNAS